MMARSGYRRALAFVQWLFTVPHRLTSVPSVDAPHMKPVRYVYLEVSGPVFSMLETVVTTQSLAIHADLLNFIKIQFLVFSRSLTT